MDAHEAAQMHQNFSQQLLQDHIAACSLPEHNLISVCGTDTSSSSSSLSCVFHFSRRDCGVSAVCLLAVLLTLQCFSFFFFQWTDGPPPVQIQAQNGPTTSLASLL